MSLGLPREPAQRCNGCSRTHADEARNGGHNFDGSESRAGSGSAPLHTVITTRSLAL